MKQAIRDVIPGFLTFTSIVLWMLDAGQVIDIDWWLILIPIWGPLAIITFLFILIEKILK